MVAPLYQTRIPVGSNVAKKFPWWKEGTATLAALANTQATVIFSQGQSTIAHTCKNNTRFPLDITELRFWVDESTIAGPVTVDGTELVMARLGCTKYTIVNDWVTLRSLQTRHDHLTALGELSSYSIPLPSPYYLQHGKIFKLEIQHTNAAFNGLAIDIAIRGIDPNTNIPIVLSKIVTLNAAINTPVTVAFDDNRSSNLRDCVIQDIAFGLTRVENTGLTFDMSRYLAVKFTPTDGPPWTDRTYTPIMALVQTVSTVNAAGNYRPLISYKPSAPIVLAQGDELRVELMTNIAPLAPLSVMCWAIGQQRGL